MKKDRFTMLVFLSTIALLAAPRFSAADGCEVTIDFLAKGVGSSVVGAGTVHPLLDIGKSGDNEVVVLQELVNPVAFGANSSGIKNVANACLGPGGGFADVGSGTYSPDTKVHEYIFTFVGGTTVSEFSVRMKDWGDYLPYGASPDGSHRMILTAWDASGHVLDSDTIAFTSTSAAKNARPSDEFGSLAVAGDACEAGEQQPGNYRFSIRHDGIAKLTLQAYNPQSLDPHIGFAQLCFTPTITDIQVEVDVKPGESPNRLNAKSQGTFPAAIVTTATFDAATVNPATVTLAGVHVATKKNGGVQSAMEDVSGDGKADLVMHFETAAIPVGEGVLKLEGETKDGKSIVGEDEVEWVQ